MDLLNQSDLFAGGLDKKNMYFLSKDTKSALQSLKDFGSIVNDDDFRCPEESEHDKLLNAVIYSGKNKHVDDIVNALQ